jgi:hypothetical protein
VVDKSEEQEVLDVNVFVTEPAVVGLSVGLTLNLGDFESARVEVSARVPCYVEEMDDAYVCVEKWVEERIGKERDEVRRVIRERKGN